MLQLDNISFAYHSEAARHPLRRDGFLLEGVTFDLRRGAITGLLGPNGSGKTTLLRIADGLLRPDRGRVLLDGADIATFSRRALARRVAVVPQETHVAFDFTALDIVLMGRYPHLGALQIEDADDLRIAREAMSATGTETFASRRFETLSGGEKQRVVIASAIAQASDVLLLDEPTASLDIGFQLEIAALLRSLNRTRAATMLLSTHDLNLAAELCTDLVLLRDGRVVAAGPTDCVLTADAVMKLYGVEADVRPNPRTGHPMVVPIARVH